MPAPLIRYELDITGLNPDNLVAGELHNLSDKTVRAITPIHGPFFADSTLKVYDNSNGAILTRGTHFQCVELLQDATLQYGKEICSVILIIETSVSPEVRIDYQVLGGAFHNDSSAIASLYETVMADNRPVHWENVLNKPLEYPPTLHRHLLEDLYGFEPVVAALERIRNAILLSDVPAFEALIDYIRMRLTPLTCREASKNIPINKVVTYDKLLVIFTRMGLLGPYRFGYIPERIHEGSAIQIPIIATGVHDGTVVYWRIIHHDTDDSDFMADHGAIVVRDEKAFIPIQLIMDMLGEKTERFSIGLLATPADEEYIGVSCSIHITDADATDRIMTAASIFDCPEDIYDSETYINGADPFLSCAKDSDPLMFPSNNSEHSITPYMIFDCIDCHYHYYGSITSTRAYMSCTKNMPLDGMYD